MNVCAIYFSPTGSTEKIVKIIANKLGGYQEIDLSKQESHDVPSYGAGFLPSSLEIIRDSFKTGMLPTIDSAKTLGIVSLPGLILAGAAPIEAIQYQIMVTFMLLSTTSIASLPVIYLTEAFLTSENNCLI